MPNIYGEETWFNGNVTFYSDVEIGGNFKYDNLSVKTLSVGDDVKISSGIVTATKFVGNGADLTGIVTIPTGVIVMWSGSIASIPSGWALCDGTNSTPDLRDRFVVGAGVSYSVDATGGSASVTLTDAQMPVHNHTMETGGSHSHTYSYSAAGGSGNELEQSGAPDGARLQSYSGTTSEHNGHTHTINNAGGSGGTTQAHENLPPYYALAFIMKT